jgi:hypothetical protein
VQARGATASVVVGYAALVLVNMLHAAAFFR